MRPDRGRRDSGTCLPPREGRSSSGAATAGLSRAPPMAEPSVLPDPSSARSTAPEREGGLGAAPCRPPQDAGHVWGTIAASGQIFLQRPPRGAALWALGGERGERKAGGERHSPCLPEGAAHLEHPGMLSASPGRGAGETSAPGSPGSGSGSAGVQPPRRPGWRLPSPARGVLGRASARALPRRRPPGAHGPRGGCEQACFGAGLPPHRANTGPAWPRSPLGAEGATERQRFNEGLFGSL